jgi:hypothetical protein
MKTLMKLTVMLGMTLCMAPAMASEDGGDGGHGPGLKPFNAQAGSFSDGAVAAESGESCAQYLKVMMDDESYKLLGITGVQGPPGVVYTLQNHKGEIAIVKCRAGGCDHGDEGSSH